MCLTEIFTFVAAIKHFIQRDYMFYIRTDIAISSLNTNSHRAF